MILSKDSQMKKNNIHILSRGVLVHQEHILVCKTLDLPVSFYFLPGGHVEHDEQACEAILREMTEEAGAKCRVKRFLGCLEHSFEPGHNSICHNHEYNLIFELESDELSIHKKIPRFEDHIELLWVPLEQLVKIDFRPEPLKKFLPYWLTLPPSDVFGSVMRETKA